MYINHLRTNKEYGRVKKEIEKIRDVENEDQKAQMKVGAL